MDILDYLANDNYVVVNKSLIKIFGLEGAVLLGELCSEYKYWKRENRLENDMFYSTIDNIEENTGLTAHKQRQAIKALENADVLITELKGVPAKKYFKIDFNSVVKILTSSNADFSQLDVKKLHSNNNNKSNKENNISISKDIDSDFQFGIKKSKTKTRTMWDKCVSVIDDFTNDMILREYLVKSLQLFLENSRESNTPFYTNNFIGKLNKLKSLSDDTKTQIKIVSQTIDNGWNGFYELKTNSKSKDLREKINESGARNVPHSNKRKEQNFNGGKKF